MTPTNVRDAAENLDAAIRQLIESNELQLPVLPEAATGLLKACNDRECKPEALVEEIRRDASIATHVLRLSNSALYNASSPTTSLQQAIARLGLKKLREIVLIVSCQTRVFCVDGFEQEVRESFRRSMAAAVFSQEIARTLKCNVEEAFLGGLLHDIGRPILLQVISDHQKECGADLRRQDIIGSVNAFRTQVAGNLIDAWGLPSHVAEAVSNQTDALASTSRARLLNLAIAAAECLLVDAASVEGTLLGHPMVEPLNLYPDDLADISARSEHILSKALS